MQATIVDLRYRMKEVLQTLNRNEEVTVCYRGRKIATILPLRDKKRKTRVKDHAFFGILKKKKISVTKQMEKLRGSRYRDI
jgi:antitoxin (DNA-binding transcriptional repressor) of toxin-antitoxin stability system